MSSSSKSPRDYSRKYKKAVLEPWRQSHNLPPSPPSPPPHRTPPTSPITTNSLSSPSPPQDPTQNQITHELYHLSNLLEINLQRAIEITNPSPPTSPHISPPTLDQVRSGLQEETNVRELTEGEPVKSQSSRRSRPAAMHNQSERLNTAYPLPLDTAYPVLCPIQRIHPNRLIRLRMTKVIKGEFEKIKDIKVEDDSLACDSPLEVFNCEVSRLSKMDDDLFTYEVEIANIPCDLRVDDDSEHEADDMGFDPSDIAFTEWLGSKFFNYKTMDHYTMKALWIYWIRGDDEVELTDEEFSDNEDEIAEVFRIDTNIFDYETPICSTFNEFNYLLKLDSIDDTIVGNLPGTFIIENQLHYQDYEWYKALEDSELKDEALRNKAIIEGFIKDDDDESRPREGNIDEYWWRIYEYGNLEVLES
ncbi:hypothetical protein Tco_0556596 [Tanacetum coccineum]